MKLKHLALIAACMAMPALASAQEPMKMGQDSTAKMDGSKGKSHGEHGKKTRARGSRRSARGAEMNNSDHAEAMTSKGPGCERGCPSSTGVGGLTGPQFLALQQELRDRGCGNTHVTGVLDAPTKAAIKVCAKKLNVEATPAAVLTAMNIGYTVGS